MKHHTADKGDLGLAKVIADLTEKGFRICLPISEHLPFDLIAVNDEGQTSRVQSKYRKATDGVINLPLKSAYSNSQGCKSVLHDLTKIDAYAIYCPDTKQVYYIPVKSLGLSKKFFNLRLEPPKSHGSIIRYASEYLDADAIFGAVP